ncbi:MAG: phosphonate C-P lyase system protein PhnL [Flexistipes sinusarabici]|uniref:Phosphonate C-P lyase system protein PhnL n=1 Tax=Flexistipes sinusarabici TaxID=2352 RepID=A0A5D0MLS0_FLESI|nr:phosphonate C-P lyase system protein PhnL [Flexistipes sinusarabici]TYB32421.1 MAG: phosphonate C-P lyase system protein PhnL [Flexistipes sinusarabici]
MTRLQINNLFKQFVLHNKGDIIVEGFDNISFEVKEKEFISLEGPSGSGKSSVLKCIYGTYKTTDGKILYFKKDGSVTDIAAASESEILNLRKHEIGYVSQFLKILPRITAHEFVAEPLVEKGDFKQSALIRAAELLEYFGIKEKLFNLSPLTFSGGEQQRVNIAHGIIAPKNLLLLDEPTSALDSENSEKVLNKLTEIKNSGTSIIGIFHNKKIMQKISDKIYNLEDNAYAVSNQK